MRWPASLCLLLFVASGCSLVGDEPVVCTTEAVPAIVVEVRSAKTGAPEAAHARAIVSDGSFTDTLRAAGYTSEEEALTLAGAYERPGTYDVRVEKSGFETWTRRGVEAEEGVCHVKTQRLEANLDPKQ